ncbi:MAG: hypothetical protein UDB11_02915 [Peptococcaceae bacterium]|nr:hypothetical protein [Peptococcaceae bacterium]
MTDRRTLFADIEAQEAQLNSANKKVMAQISDYLETAPISRVQVANVRRDLGAMLLDGQKRGQSAKDIIGDNVQAICDDAINALPKQRLDAILPSAWVVVTTLWGFFAISYLLHLPALLRDGNALYVPFNMRTVANVLIFLIIIRGWGWLQKRRRFQHGWRTWLVPIVLLFLLASGLGIIVGQFWPQGEWKMHVALFAVLGLVPYSMWKLMRRRMDRE